MSNFLDDLITAQRNITQVELSQFEQNKAASEAAYEAWVENKKAADAKAKQDRWFNASDEEKARIRADIEEKRRRENEIA